MATHTTGKTSIEDLKAKLKKIKAEETRFALEIVVEERARVLQQLVLKRLDEVITLDDILEAFINKKKTNDISVWALGTD